MKRYVKIVLPLLLALIAPKTVAEDVKVNVESESPLKINIGSRSLTLRGYAQSNYTVTQKGDETTNGFEIRRIIVMADAQLTPKLNFWVMADLASFKLHEYYAQYSFNPALKLRVGQFKQPFTLENIYSPSMISNLNFDESILYMAGIGTDPCFGFGRVGRDAGIMLTGDVIPYKGETLLNYSVGVFNGSGMNVKENNKYKDVIGMIRVKPWQELLLTTSFVVGKAKAQADSPYGTFKTGENYKRNRWSAGAELTTKPLYVRSELMLGDDGGVHSTGFYGVAEGHINKHIDVVAGYDYLKRNNNVSASVTNNYMAGLQFWIFPKCGIRTQYVYKNPKTGDATHQWITQFQVAF